MQYYRSQAHHKKVAKWACKPDSVPFEENLIQRWPFLWNLSYPRLQATYPRTSVGPTSLPIWWGITSPSKQRFVPLFGLAPGDAYPAICVTTNAVGSYPTISPLPGWSNCFSHRRYLFCGAGVGLLRLGVTQHLALWSPDFPLTNISQAATRPTYPTVYHARLRRNGMQGERESKKNAKRGSPPQDGEP